VLWLPCGARALANTLTPSLPPHVWYIPPHHPSPPSPAFTNCPFGEMMLLGGPQGALQPQFCGLFVDEPQPDASGYLRLSDRPGFGLTVNKALRLLRPYSRVPASYEEIEAVKDQRTPTPRQWLAVAERSIPLGSPFKPEEA
jgi:hypothetical protein